MMLQIEEALPLLCCPQCRSALQRVGDRLTCSSGHAYPVWAGIARFVDDARSGYERHWQRHAAPGTIRQKEEQARQFCNWVQAQVPELAEARVVADIGCGDGYHLPHLPANAVKIAIDYTGVVDTLAARYHDMPNLLLLQADAQHLPLRDASVAVLLGYGCYNLVPDMPAALREAERVACPGGCLALWGYGTDSRVQVALLRAARKFHHSLPEALRPLLAYALIPGLLVAPGSTGISPLRNTLRECAEIVSTNLAPDHLHVFCGDDWRAHVGTGWQHLADYQLPVGQLFRKR